MTANPQPPTPAGGRWKPSFQLIQAGTVLLLLLGLCAVSASQTETFLTWQNLVYNLLTNAAYLGIMACGMTFVMVARAASTCRSGQRPRCAAW